MTPALSSLKIQIYSPVAKRARQWADELGPLLHTAFDPRFSFGKPSAEEDVRVLILDAGDPALESTLAEISRSGRALFLVCEDADARAVALLEAHAVDGLLTTPFRVNEVLQSFLAVSRILMWDEVGHLNKSISGILEELRGDLELAERLQKAQSPKRFPKIRGIHVSSRYLAGERAGGDFFDLAEGQEGQNLSILLSDASSYGLSSAVLGALMKVAVRLSADESRSCVETVRKIQAELRATLREGDRHSLFYGIFSRRDHKLRYLHLGTAAVWYRSPKGELGWLLPQGGPMSRHSQTIQVEVRELTVEPGARLILASDGLLEAVGGREKVDSILSDHEADKLLNELIYQAKKSVKQRGDLLAQDCSVMILEFDAKSLRLAG